MLRKFFLSSSLLFLTNSVLASDEHGKMHQEDILNWHVQFNLEKAPKDTEFQFMDENTLMTVLDLEKIDKDSIFIEKTTEDHTTVLFRNKKTEDIPEPEIFGITFEAPYVEQRFDQEGNKLILSTIQDVESTSKEDSLIEIPSFQDL